MRCLFLLVVLLFSLFAVSWADTTAAVVSPAAVVSAPATVDTVLSNVGSVLNVLKEMKAGSVAVIVFLAALIKLLISLFRLPVLAGLLNTAKMKPWKPYIALVLGVLSGFVTGVSSGQSWLMSLVTGLLAGLGAVGMHESVKSLLGKNK